MVLFVQCLHQLLLVSVLLFGIVQMRFLETQELRMAAVIEDRGSILEYNEFESHLSSYVNNLYFDVFFSGLLEDSAADWLVKLVEKCPKRMRHDNCGASEAKAICDFSSKLCCPSESLCSSGVKEACPYEACRGEILGELLYELLVPMRIGALSVCVLSGLMILLSCLLICFNKRDEIEVELLKTGNISEEDIEAIRRLKSSKARDDTIDFEQLAPRFGSRKRRVQVSPTPLELA